MKKLTKIAIAAVAPLTAILPLIAAGEGTKAKKEEAPIKEAAAKVTVKITGKTKMSKQNKPFHMIVGVKTIEEVAAPAAE